MRISDWSSDVCSSDLCRIGRVSQPKGCRPGGLFRRHSHISLAQLRLSSRTSEQSERDPESMAGPSARPSRSDEHTSELQTLMRISYAVLCLRKKNTTRNGHQL